MSAQTGLILADLLISALPLRVACMLLSALPGVDTLSTQPLVDEL